MILECLSGAKGTVALAAVVVSTLLALAADSAMLTDPAPSTLLAPAASSAMLTDLAPSTLLALFAFSAMLADTAPSTLLACAALSAMWARHFRTLPHLRCMGALGMSRHAFIVGIVVPSRDDVHWCFIRHDQAFTCDLRSY